MRHPATSHARENAPRLAARLGLVIVGCLVAVAGFACSQRGDANGGRSAASSGAPADVLLAAATKSTSSDTVHLKVSMSLDSSATGSQQINGKGEVDFANKQASIDIQLLGMDANVITTDDAVYISAPLLGDGWYRLSGADLGGGSASQLFSSGFIDPSRQFAFIKDASSDVSRVGTEKIDGDATTHYRATIDVVKAAANAGATDQGLQALKESGISSVPIDAWVDEQGRVARMALEYAGTQGALAGDRLTVTVDYFDYGKPVDIAVPPADQVRDFSESGIGQLLGGGAAEQ